MKIDPQITAVAPHRIQGHKVEASRTELPGAVEHVAEISRFSGSEGYKVWRKLHAQLVWETSEHGAEALARARVRVRVAL